MRNELTCLATGGRKTCTKDNVICAAFEELEKVLTRKTVGFLSFLHEFSERRADNVVFRAGFATTRRQARQLVSHGHFLLNGRRIDIPSIRLKAGDVLEVREKSVKSEYFKNLENTVAASGAQPLSWLKADAKKMRIEITGTPKREEAEAGINEQLIVEYYSR